MVFLTLCMRETPNRAFFTNVEDQGEMQHYAGLHCLLCTVKEILRPKNTIFLKIIT